jgi:hypothetical protein
MTEHLPRVVPRQVRRRLPHDEVEREVARTAELVLRLTALADRYDTHPASRERVVLLRATAALARRALLELAAEPASA